MSFSNFNFRIIRKLILEKYLWEEITVSDMGMVSAYVKPGPKLSQAKTSKFTLDIQKKTKDAAVVKESTSTDNLTNDNGVSPWDFPRHWIDGKSSATAIS